MFTESNNSAALAPTATTARLSTSWSSLRIFPRGARTHGVFAAGAYSSVGAHVVIYVIEGEGILVIRVLHGRQDWERYL